MEIFTHGQRGITRRENDRNLFLASQVLIDVTPNSLAFETRSNETPLQLISALYSCSECIRDICLVKNIIHALGL